MALMTYTSMAAEYPDKIRALAVAADKRANALPDVPTFKELGYDYVEGAYRGVAVPREHRTISRKSCRMPSRR